MKTLHAIARIDSAAAAVAVAFYRFSRSFSNAADYVVVGATLRTLDKVHAKVGKVQAELDDLESEASTPLYQHMYAKAAANATLQKELDVAYAKHTAKLNAAEEQRALAETAQFNKEIALLQELADAQEAADKAKALAQELGLVHSYGV